MLGERATYFNISNLRPEAEREFYWLRQEQALTPVPLPVLPDRRALAVIRLPPKDPITTSAAS